MIFSVALNMVEGLKPIHRAALLKAFGSPESVFRQAEMDLVAVPEIKPEMAYRILHFNMTLAKAEMAKAKELGFDIVSYFDQYYPSLLKAIPDPPLVLYMKGELKEEEPTVALVGSRKATPYGLNVADYLSRDLSTAGVTVVSGLARGIDARAHSAAIQSGGRTIAVLGSGSDVIYPPEHKHLAEKIAGSGAVISEFPLGTPPNRENFPVRNRIISGLSYAVVVVEASRKSGSLITSRTAAEQGREVLAVPGSIFNESSQGCNALIKDGATLVESWKDIIRVLPENVSEHIKAPEEEEGDRSGSLTELEQKVMNLLSFEEPRHVDHLAAISGFRSQELLGTLVSLEIRNYITQMPGKQFLRVK